MDFLQTQKYGNKTRTFRSWIRVREDPELLVQIRWYTAPPGAAVFPGVHSFGRLMWDRFAEATPPTGLGVTSFSESDTCPDYPPPGITGVSCNTPLDWFLNGVPANVSGPWPYPPCPTFGEAWILQAWASPGGTMGTSVIPLAGLTVAEFSLRACVNRWQVMLWVNPSLTPGSTTQFSDLQEVVFTGYSRQSPVFSTTQQQADGSSVTVSAPLAWVFGGGAPVSVYGWALLDPGSSQIIALARLTGAPTQLVNPGDRVFIPAFWFVLSPFQPVIPMWTGSVGLGLAAVAHGTGYPGTESRFYLWANGFGVDSLAFDWSAANGTYVLNANPIHTVWTSPSFVVGGRSCSFSLTFAAGNLPTVVFSWTPHGRQAQWPNVNTPWNFVLPLRLDGATGVPFPPAPAYFPIILSADQTEVDVPTLGSLVFDAGQGPVPSQHVLADGSAISRTTYSALFALWGTFFGVGDGSTTFNVPDMRDRLPRGTSPGGLGSDRPSAVTPGQVGGEETHLLQTTEIPGHTHTITDPGHTHQPTGGSTNLVSAAGAGVIASGANQPFAGVGGIQSATTGITGTNSTGGGGSHNNLPPNMGWRALIFTGV